ncbi:MAG TPA: response regulator [Rhizomicrobium sp.]|nr:response regulator [Rhizomicrobium sp.]
MDLAQRIVCVVDDDGGVRESLRMLLERHGLTVRCYANAQIFLGQENLAECGCVLIDQLMPGMNGVALLEALRSRRVQAPAIFITGDSDPQLPGRARRAGAMAVLHKPIVNAELLGWIELAFSGA